MAWSNLSETVRKMNGIIICLVNDSFPEMMSDTSHSDPSFSLTFNDCTVCESESDLQPNLNGLDFYCISDSQGMFGQHHSFANKYQNSLTLSDSFAIMLKFIDCLLNTELIGGKTRLKLAPVLS